MNSAKRSSVRVGRVSALLTGGLLIASMLPIGFGAVVLAAGVSVTPADASVSADTSLSGSTPLAGPALTENIAGDLGNGSIVLGLSNASFVFDTASGSILPSGCTGRGASVTGVTATSVTADISGTSIAACTFTFVGLRVRAAVGAAAGVTASITASGTATNLPTGGYGTLTEVAGAAATMTFTTQPAGAAVNGTTTVAGGEVWTTQPAVTAKDQFDQNAAGNVTFSIKTGTGTSGATLTCGGSGANGTTFTLSSGAVTASSCRIDRIGTGYIILASSPGQTAAIPQSNPFSVVAGSATGLVFTASPASTTTTNLGTIRVAMVDAGGNTVTTAPAAATTIALSLNSGSLFSCSPGTSQVIAASSTTPSATFSGCTTAVGTGRVLTATASGGLSATKTTTFNVTSGAASKVVFTVQPAAAVSNGSTSVTGGVVWATQPSVALQDSGSNVVTSDNSSTITLTITPATPTSGGPGAVSCTTNPKSAVAGVATFSGCTIGKTGVGYKIRATSSLGYAVDSYAFTVVAGAASKLAFTSQPSGSSANTAFAIQPVVVVQDAGGNTITTGTGSTATIALSLGTNTTGGILTCTTSSSRTAVVGIATFSGCKIDRAGTYTLVASATGLSTATSNSFVVTAPAAAITLTKSASVITWGGGIVLTIQFGANGANKAFVLESARDGVTWTPIANLITNAFGSATLSYRPASNLYYRARFTGTPDLTAGDSNTTRTVVRQIALLRPTNSGLIKTISRNTSITFTTTVRPARPELVPATVRFVLYRRIGLSWTFVTQRDVVSSFGLASTTFKFSTAGSWYVRSRANPTPDNANSFWSRLERYSVR